MNIGLVALILGAFAVMGAAAKGTNSQDLATVQSVDLKRYAGKWYEIARYPNRFQKDCVGNTTAEYTLKGEGKLEVVNSCVQQNGLTKTARGVGKIDDKVTNAKLKVRFAPAILSFIPAVWGDYWILELGPNYEYSVIGDPKREYFWILSREPKMDEKLYQEILRRAEKKGFQPGRVQRTSQKIDVIRGDVIDRS